MGKVISMAPNGMKGMMTRTARTKRDPRGSGWFGVYW